MKLLTYVPPKFTAWQLDQLSALKTESAFQYLSNSFRLNQSNFSPENLARPKAQRVQAVALLKY